MEQGKGTIRLEKQTEYIINFLCSPDQEQTTGIHRITEVGDQGSARTKKIVLYGDTWTFTVLYG
jgi:hypothetical protein